MGNHTLPETSSTYCKTQRVVQLASLECKKAYSYLIETETKSRLHALVLSKDLLGEHSIFFSLHTHLHPASYVSRTSFWGCQAVWDLTRVPVHPQIHSRGCEIWQKAPFMFSEEGRERCHTEQGSTGTDKGLSEPPLVTGSSRHVIQLISGSIIEFNQCFQIMWVRDFPFYSALLSTTSEPLGEQSEESLWNVRSNLWINFSLFNV